MYAVLPTCQPSSILEDFEGKQISSRIAFIQHLLIFSTTSLRCGRLSCFCKYLLSGLLQGQFQGPALGYAVSQVGPGSKLYHRYFAKLTNNQTS